MDPKQKEKVRIPMQPYTSKGVTLTVILLQDINQKLQLFGIYQGKIGAPIFQQSFQANGPYSFQKRQASIS
jgi:hypothetical protein